MESNPYENTEPQTSVVAFKASILALEINESFAVKDDADAVGANGLLGDIKQVAKKVEARKKELLEPLNKQVQAIRDAFREPENLLENAEKLVKLQLAGFLENQRRLREAAEAAARTEALRREQAARERAAEEQRAAALKAAEERRAADEQAAKLAQEAEEEAERLRASGLFAQAAEKEAEAQERAAAIQSAADQRAIVQEELAVAKSEAKLDRVLESTAALVSSAAAPATKLAGLSTRDNWTGEVTNLVAFVQYLIAENLPLEDYLSVKASGVKNLAKTVKRTRVVPGLRVANEASVARRV